ncbi:MAG: hypothetical protein V4622_09160 [Bacteroidota bacterium]
MKIRIKGNSLRYRLTKSEVELFSKEGYLEEKTHFPSHVFTYALEAKKDISELQASYSNDKISLFFPDSEKEKWFQSDQIGYESSMNLENEMTLKILVEKDFVCLDHIDEDQSDNFPNPNLTC